MSEVGVLLLTHGSSGGAMLSTVRQLVGQPLDSFLALGIGHGDVRESVQRQLDDAMVMLDKGAGVLIVCDLWGSTPANLALEKLRDGAHVAVLAGINLPMLVKLATANRTTLSPAGLAKLGAETGVKSIRRHPEGDQ